MKLEDYINETGKVIDLNKERHNQNSDELKEIHNELVHITNSLRKLLEKNNNTSSILMLLVSAKRELKKYIDERD